MKFSVAAFLAAAFAGLVNAQSACLTQAEAIPSCGQACLTSAASSQGCHFTDFACQCSHSAAINGQALTACVSSACTASTDVLAVSSSAQAVCGCLGTAAANAPVTSNAPIPTSTHAISVTGAAPSYAVLAAAGTTSAAAKTSAVKVSQQAAGSPATSALSKFTGGAATAAGSFGGVVAAVLGLVAAL